jgi:hypothetical protein
MILLAFPSRAARRRGLRPTLGPVEFNAAVLHMRRVKNRTPSTHPLLGDELRALRPLQRETPASPFIFVSECGFPVHDRRLCPDDRACRRQRGP